MHKLLICIIICIIMVYCEIYFNSKILNNIKEICFNPFYIVYTFSIIIGSLSILLINKSKTKTIYEHALKHACTAYIIALCAHLQILTVPFILIFFAYRYRALTFLPYM